MTHDLNLSQNLTINNHFTISCKGECDKTYGSCSLDGWFSGPPHKNIWYALTDQAFDVWKGEIKEKNGIFYGLLKHIKEESL